MSPRAWSVLAIVAVACAYGFMGQRPTDGPLSHLALVRALATGTPEIDETLADQGTIVTYDVVRYEGHLFSNKAPGLAFLTLPLYKALDAAGVRTSGDPERLLWMLGLLGTALPAAVTVLVAWWLAERLEPGLGAATAVTMGLGTLLFPYASLFFAHALSAFLVFAALALLWREREGPERLALLGLAGLAAGYAITTEYPSAIAMLVLGAFALARSGRRLRRGLVYGAGVLAGVAPLLAYDSWAFDSPLRLSYGAASLTDLGSTPGAGDARFFGVGAPSFSVATSLLVHGLWGLLTTTPVLALGVAGTVMLYRRGRRAEALAIGSAAALFVAYNSGFWGPWGGTPGTRYLIPVVPLLALPVALACRAWPLTTAALALASVGVMTAFRATDPIWAWDGHVLDRLGSADGSAPTAADFVGITGGYDIVPLYAFVVGALVCAARATRATLTARELPAAVAAVAGWALVARSTPSLLAEQPLGRNGTALLALLLAGTVVAAVAALLARASSTAAPGRAPPRSIIAAGVRDPRHPPA